MPTWHELPEKDRDRRDRLHQDVLVALEGGEAGAADRRSATRRRPTPELLARGKALYAQAKCFQCHGEGGKGDGPSADELQDDLKFPIRPADFTRGQFKGGGDVRDIYRTMTTGLDGTPMPSFADSMKDDERWAISYYVLSFSAFNDPLTGEKLKLDAGRADAPQRARRRGARHARGWRSTRRRRRTWRAAEAARPLPQGHPGGGTVVDAGAPLPDRSASSWWPRCMGLGALCLFLWAVASGLLPRRGAREVPGARLRGDRRWPMSDEDDVTHPEWTEAPHEDPPIETFAGGEIRSFHGTRQQLAAGRLRHRSRCGASTTCSGTGAGLGPGLAR